MYINNDIDYLSFLKGKSVYVFGCGVRGKRCCSLLEKNNITVIAFLDNNSENYDVKVMNKSVISLDDYLGEKNNCMIVICSTYEREIKLQLLNRNIFNFISESQIDFGGGSDYYDEKYFEWQRTMGEFGGRIKAEKFKAHIKKEMVVVEFGSGGGYLLNNLEAKERIGIEINDTARKQAESLGIKCYKYTQELPDNYADIIISSSVLEHVENPLGELKYLKDKLKIGGKIVFHVPNESCDKEYVRSEINNHLYTWNCLNLGNLFKAAGFFVCSVENVQEVWPAHFAEIEQEVSKEFFDSICKIGGKAFDEHYCIIVAMKV